MFDLGCWVSKGPRKLAVAGALISGMGVALDAMPGAIFNGADFWRASPNLFLMKVGAVCILLAGMTALAQSWKSIPKTTVARLSRESLIVYIGHPRDRLRICMESRPAPLYRSKLGCSGNTRLDQHFALRDDCHGIFMARF